MSGVAVPGLAVNITAYTVLHGADRTNLKVRGALLHILGDLLGSPAAACAALPIMTAGVMPANRLRFRPSGTIRINALTQDGPGCAAWRREACLDRWTGP